MSSISPKIGIMMIANSDEVMEFIDRTVALFWSDFIFSLNFVSIVTNVNEPIVHRIPSRII